MLNFYTRSKRNNTKKHADNKKSTCNIKSNNNKITMIDKMSANGEDQDEAHDHNTTLITNDASDCMNNTDIDASDHDNNAASSDVAIIPKTRDKPRFIMEPAVFLVTFATGLVGTVIQNQYLFQSCTAVFHYNRSDCEPLLGIIKETNTSKQIEDIVQPYVANILMTSSLIGSILPAIISLFIGPWSDKFGRRSIIMITYITAFIGYIISTIMTGISLRYEFNPWIYLIALIPSVLTGGSCAMTIVTNSYITDVAPEHLKGLCLVLNDAAYGLGLFLGNLVGGYLFIATNMSVVYCVSAVAIIPAFLYVLCFVKEVIPSVDVPFKSKIRQFFSFTLVMELIRTCFLRPASYERTFLWLTMLALIISNFTWGGSNVIYLFIRKQFDVSVSQYTTYTSISSAIQIAGGILGMVLLRKCFRFSINTMALFALGSLVLNSSIVAAAAKFWELYLAAAFNILGGICSPMLLTMLAHLASSADIGKIYSLITSIQTITPLASTPVYTAVYNATLSYYPGMFNIISVALYLVTFTLIAIIYGIRRANKLTLL